MAVLSSSSVQLAIVEETTWGQTPLTPAFERLRVTSDNLMVDRENIVSTEKRPDRNVTDLIQVGGGASGSIGFELSYGTFDKLIASMMHSEWVDGVVADPDLIVTAATMTNGAYVIAAQPAEPAAVTVTRTVAGGEDTAGKIIVTGTSPSGSVIAEELVPGADGVTVSGSKIFATVTSVVGVDWVTDGTDDSITVGVAASGGSIKNGIKPKSFTFERLVPTGEATAEYMRFTGMQVNSMTLNANSKEIVNGTMEFLGSGGAVAATALAGATYADMTTTDVMDAGTGFAGLSLGSLTGAHVLGLSLTATNNLRTASELGNVNALGVGYGRFEVSGSIDIYFEDTSVMEAFLAGDAVALAFTVGKETGQKYTFSIPKVKFESGGLNVGGNDEDLIVNLQWKGLYDSATDCTMTIARAVV